MILYTLINIKQACHMAKVSEFDASAAIVHCEINVFVWKKERFITAKSMELFTAACQNQKRLSRLARSREKALKAKKIKLLPPIPIQGGGPEPSALKRSVFIANTGHSRKQGSNRGPW